MEGGGVGDHVWREQDASDLGPTCPMEHGLPPLSVGALHVHSQTFFYGLVGPWPTQQNTCGGDQVRSGAAQSASSRIGWSIVRMALATVCGWPCPIIKAFHGLVVV